MDIKQINNSILVHIGMLLTCGDTLRKNLSTVNMHSKMYFRKANLTDIIMTSLIIDHRLWK